MKQQFGLAMALVLCAGLSAPLWALAETAGEPVFKTPRLIGGISQTESPFAADGSMKEIPANTAVNFTVLGNINSELTKVGDEVNALVSVDVSQDGKVVLPGQWVAHGVVSEAEGRRRLGRNGYVTVKFDKLISPDGKYVVPFEAEASTKDSTAKAIAKTVAVDSVWVSRGAVGGAIISVQLTGIPLAIATHGYSVAGGAAVGGTLGLIGALKRKGKISCTLPGEELKLKIQKPVIMPVFNATALPSAAPIKKVENLEIVVVESKFAKDPFGDKRSRLLKVVFIMENRTDRQFGFGNMVIVSDHNHMYYPYALASDAKLRTKKVGPKSSAVASMTFSVDGPNRKYWLLLLDSGNVKELTRVPIN